MPTRHTARLAFRSAVLALASAAAAAQGYTEGQDAGGADASPVFALGQNAGALPITGSLPRVGAVHDADTYQVCGTSTTTTIDRWYADTELGSTGRPNVTWTFVSHGNSFERTFLSAVGIDDNRSNFVGLLDPLECFAIGVSHRKGSIAAGPGIDVSASNQVTVQRYIATALASRRIRTDRIVMLAQQEINDVTDPRIPTIDCDQTELATWIYEGRGTYSPDVEHVMVRLGASCAGVRARTYGNVGNDVVELRPDGSVVQARFSNIRFNDFADTPGIYPAPAPFQTRRDWGADAQIPLTAGNTLVSGVVTVEDNGAVRNASTPPTAVWDVGSAQEVKRSLQLIHVVRPSVAWASAPVRVTRDAATGAEAVVIETAGSRQVSGFRIEAPGVAADLIAVTDATAAARWSQDAPAGTVFTDILPLPPGTLPADGTPVTIRVTPLGADAHWDFARLATLAIEVTTPVVVASAEAPAAAAALRISVSPNPMRAVGQITVTLAAPQVVRVEVIDTRGRVVAVVHDGPLGAGSQALPVEARGLAAGVYLVRVTSASGVVAARTVSVVR